MTSVSTPVLALSYFWPMTETARILTVIQARRGSSRLPDKISMPILGKPLLIRMVERVQRAKLVGRVVVATTTDAFDDPVEEVCRQAGIDCFRGHPTDLLDRHYRAGKAYDAEVVIKIPSDVPLIDHKVIDGVIQFFLANRSDYDFVSNLHPPTYPDGMDVEIMPMELLELAWKEADKPMEREHTTPFFWEQPDRFRIGNLPWASGKDYSMSHRFTIDYAEDYDFIKTVYEELHPQKPDFGLDDVLNLLERKPAIYQINSKFAGVNWYRNHLDELKTVTDDQTRQIDP